MSRISVEWPIGFRSEAQAEAFGLAHLAEHVHFRNGPMHAALEDELLSVGGRTWGFTRPDYTLYCSEAEAGDFSLALRYELGRYGRPASRWVTTQTAILARELDEKTMTTPEDDSGFSRVLSTLFLDPAHGHDGFFTTPSPQDASNRLEGFIDATYGRTRPTVVVTWDPSRSLPPSEVARQVSLAFSGPLRPTSGQRSWVNRTTEFSERTAASLYVGLLPPRVGLLNRAALSFVFDTLVGPAVGGTCQVGAYGDYWSAVDPVCIWVACDLLTVADFRRALSTGLGGTDVGCHPAGGDSVVDFDAWLVTEFQRVEDTHHWLAAADLSDPGPWGSAGDSRSLLSWAADTLVNIDFVPVAGEA